MQIVAVTNSASNLQRNIFAHVTNTNAVWRRHFDDFNRCLSLCSEYFLRQKMIDAVNGGDAVHRHRGENIYKIVAGAKIDSSEFQQMSNEHIPCFFLCWRIRNKIAQLIKRCRGKRMEIIRLSRLHDTMLRQWNAWLQGKRWNDFEICWRTNKRTKSFFGLNETHV